MDQHEELMNNPPMYEAEHLIDQLRNEVERLRKALEFYAERQNWTRFNYAGASTASNDEGKIAREALGEEQAT